MTKRFSLLSLFVVFLLGAAIAHPARAADRPEVVWSERQIMFWAEPATGAVHVIGLRSGVSEYAVLRAPQRRDVQRLAFDARSRRLTVEASDGDYVYDAWSLKLIARQPTALAAERFRYPRP
jgi:hypothetical protein